MISLFLLYPPTPHKGRWDCVHSSISALTYALRRACATAMAPIIIGAHAVGGQSILHSSFFIPYALYPIPSSSREFLLHKNICLQICSQQKRVRSEFLESPLFIK